MSAKSSGLINLEPDGVSEHGDASGARSGGGESPGTLHTAASEADALEAAAAARPAAPAS